MIRTYSSLFQNRIITGFIKHSTLLISLYLIIGCSAPGNDPSQKIQAIEKMRAETLNTLYKKNPDAKLIIQTSAGYAVFSNANIYVLFISGGAGYGVVVDNKNTQKTYMKMAAGGLGLGAGAKDYRLVLAFKNPSAMKTFIEKGWQFGGQADAAAKAKDKGGAIGGEVAANEVTIYELTEAGLALQITAQGTKFWKDENLNN